MMRDAAADDAACPGVPTHIDVGSEQHRAKHEISLNIGSAHCRPLFKALVRNDVAFFSIAFPRVLSAQTVKPALLDLMLN